MLRLTLRSGRDGRLLARIVERDGVAFVLDYGDPDMVADASRRVLHGGFAVRWQDAVETATPGAPGLIRQLALYYASQGLLVFVDEPTWMRRGALPPEDAPRPLDSGPPTLLPDDPADVAEDTEILSRKDLAKVLAKAEERRGRREVWTPPPVSEDETEFIDDDDTVELGRLKR